ncbi:MAG: TonB-dependent receptor domain-containing protein [Steroidobacteraceae bacterium]
MNHTDHHHDRRRLGWLVAPLLLMAALCAQAQTSAQTSAPKSAQKLAQNSAPIKAPSDPPQTVPQQRASTASSLHEVVITGSRIARPPNDRAEPTIEITPQTFVKRGYTNIGQALTELPEFGVQPASQQNQQSAFGVGQSFVDLYSLGSQRTLVLVNGNRFVSSNTPSLGGATNPGSQVDLNDIPIQLIKSVQTISIGGAPIYGADAIAGTVNIITRNDYQGLALDAQGGTTSVASARDYRLSALAGTNFAGGRGNVLGVVEYTLSDGIEGPQVPYYAANASESFLAPAIPGKYQTVLIPNADVSQLSTSGVPYLDNGDGAGFYTPGVPNGAIGIVNAAGQPLAFSPGSSALTPYNIGRPTGNPIWFSGGQGVNLVNYQNLQDRIERVNADTIGHFNWTDHVQTFWEGWFTGAHNRALISQPLYDADIFGAPGSPTGPLIMSVYNPYLSPADQTLIHNELLAYQADGYPGAGYFGSVGAPLDPNWNSTHFYLDRASTDLESGGVINDDVLGRGVLGMKGDFKALNHDYHWDITGNYGYSRVESHEPIVDFQNLENALNTVRNSSGQIVCAPGETNSPYSTEASTCAPLNPFGLGSPSAAARAYVTHIGTAESYDTQRDVTANLTGPLVTLPAGDWQFAAGYENRREAQVFQPDAFLAAQPPVSDSTAQAIEGAYHTNEVYGETLIPLFEPKQDIPALHRVEVEGAIRRVDNSIAGNSNTWTASLRWAPTRDIMFRYNKTVAIRAPSITELFLPPATSDSFANDPCDKNFVNQGPNPALRAKNCEAAGLNPATFTSDVVNATAQGLTSGSTALQSEVAHSYTYGFVFTPRWVRNLSFSVNYLSIKMANAIESLTLTDILDACYDSAGYPNQPECKDFTRSAQGQITSFHAGFVNAGVLTFQGETFELNYRTLLPRNLGAMEWTGNYLDTKTLEIKVGSAATENEAGALTNTTGEFAPKGRGTLSTTYLKGPFSWYWQVQYTSSMNFNNQFTPTTQNPLSIGHWWLTNSSLAYQVTGNVGLRLVVNNVFNKRPPLLALAGTPGNFFPSASYYYDGVIGRSYLLEVHADFF